MLLLLLMMMMMMRLVDSRWQHCCRRGG